MNHPLRLIKFSPSDYSLSDAMLGAETTKLTDRQALASALSLYFQWPAHRSALIYPQAAKVPVPCRLECDADEAQVSVLFVTVDENSKNNFTLDGQTARIRFEVFRTCYEMTVSILGREADSDGAGWHFAVEVPDELILFKHRRLPRVRVEPARAEALDMTLLLPSQGGTEAIRLFPSEMSMRSVRARPHASFSHQTLARLRTGSLEVPVQIMSADSETVVLNLQFVDGVQAGQFFDVYRQVAYPRLRPRGEVDALQLLALYRDTGYLDRYQPLGEQERESNEIIDAWKKLDEHAHHEAVADYVSCDDSGRLAGASGLVRCFKRQGTDIWFLNQLCALTEPDLLADSGTLYQWRSEYLVARPEEFRVMARYWSGSRWLERIYTKFAMVAKSVELLPIKSYRMNFKALSESAPLPVVAIGPWQRPLLDDGDMMGGLLPKHLNLVTALDSLVACWSSHGAEEISSKAGQMVAAAKLTEYPLTLAIPPQATPPEGAEVGKTDRLGLFGKESLVDFLTSVEHVIAVTRRKLGSAD